ncbi:protein of unknown function [Methylococcus capsulatus]|jgi:hypothetical protein|uniref:Uncharacterized protein n=1 Tax=Methylococcus capsulatus TaxID=414 RepID=A0AA35Y1B1_METCP|nr:protein of unknown function [Methylococcus capsulatus]
MYSARGRLLGMKSKSRGVSDPVDGTDWTSESFLGATVCEEHATSSNTGAMHINPRANGLNMSVSPST